MQKELELRNAALNRLITASFLTNKANKEIASSEVARKENAISMSQAQH